MRYFAGTTVLLAIALTLTSCGSGQGGDSAAPESEEWRSPIAEYLGINQSFGFGDEADFEALQIEVNERVTACMAAEGFEWLPNPQEMQMMDVAEAADGLEWGSDEWVAKYGFGISTMAFPQSTVGADLVGSNDDYVQDVEEGADPNQEYVENLSDSEREAFYAALHGDDRGPDIDPSTMTEEEIEAAVDEYYADYVPTGCMNEAQEEIMGFGGPGYFQEFQDELETMYEQIQDDPRVTEFEQEIAACVADKGLSYSDMQSLYEDLEKRMEPLYESTYGNDPFVGLSEDEIQSQLENMTEAEMQELFTPKLSDENLALLAEIQADEITLAVAVSECGGNEKAQQAVFEEVRIEYEERFIEENRAALDAFLAEQEKNESKGGDEPPES